MDFHLLEQQIQNLARKWINTGSIDESRFPAERLAELRHIDANIAPLPVEHGGLNMCIDPNYWKSMLSVLKAIGRADLCVGRIYEGHLNGVQLVGLYGTEDQKKSLASDVKRGMWSAIWNTEISGQGLMIHRQKSCYELKGRKVFCSGADYVQRPIVCGTLDDGGWQMLLIDMDSASASIDSSGWNPLGVKGTHTYKIDFTGTILPDLALIGNAGDYEKDPWFIGGGARFLALQVGAIERLLELVREDLEELRRTKSVDQQRRITELCINAEQSNLWLLRIAEHAAWSVEDPQRFVAYVCLARKAIEEMAFSSLALAQQSIGIRGMVAPHPLEKLIRDLSVYLRQPGIDAVTPLAGSFILDKAVSTEVQDLWHPQKRRHHRFVHGSALDGPQDSQKTIGDAAQFFGSTLVIAPHPDDETLGCGGLIALLRKASVPIQAMILSDGRNSHPGSRTHPPQRVAEIRKEESLRAGRIIGLESESIRFLSLTDSAFPLENTAEFDCIVQALTKHIDVFKPQSILVTCRDEQHPDHRKAFQIAYHACTRANCMPRLFEYPIWAWHPHKKSQVPQAHRYDTFGLDISQVKDLKRQGIQEHISQTTDLIGDSAEKYCLTDSNLVPFLEDREIFLEPKTVTAEYFQEKYEKNSDPWDYLQSEYEKKKRDATIEGLGDKCFKRALEVGSSIGVLTKRLSEVCEHVLGIDCAENAVNLASESARGTGAIEFKKCLLPAEFPRERFDLIVISEIGYYLSRNDLQELIVATANALVAGGTLLLVHWTGICIDHPLSARYVHARFRDYFSGKDTLLYTLTDPSSSYLIDKIVTG